MASDLQIQGEVVVNSEQAESAFDRVGDKAQQMATDVATSAGKAGQAVDKIGDGAGASAEKFTRAESRMSASIKRATNELELLGKAASQRLEFNIADKGLDPKKFEPALQKLREVEAQAQAAQRAASGSLDKMGISAAQTAAALRGVPAQFTDIITSLQGGQAPLTVFLQQGGQLKDMFGGAGAAARALGGYVVGLVNPFTVAAAAGAALAYAYSQGSKEADAYNKALIATGNAAGTNAAQLKAYAQEISAVVGTRGKAAESLAALASTGKIGAESLKEAAQAAVQYERATGQALDKTAEQFASLRNEPLAAVLKLNDGMNFLTDSTYKQIKSLEEQGKTAKAANVAQRAFADTLAGRAGEMERNLGSVERGWLKVKDAAKGAWDAMLNIGRGQTNNDRLQDINKQLEDLQRRAAPGFGETEGGAATGRAGASASVQAKIAALQAQKAAIEGVIWAEKENGRVQAETAKNNTLLFDWDKQGESFTSKAQKRDAEILKARTEGQQLINAGLISEAGLRERIRSIEDKYKETGGGGKAGVGENEVAGIRAKTLEQERYLKLLQEQGGEALKLTEGEKLVIKIQEELKTSISGAARAQKEKALAAAEALAAADKQVIAEQAHIKALAHSEEGYRKDLAAMAQRTDAINQQAADMEAANAVYGKGKIAIEQYNLQLDQERLKRMNNLGLQGATTEELAREIDARKRLVEAMTQAEIKQTNQRLDEWKRSATEQAKLYEEEANLAGLTVLERDKIVAARQVELKLAKEIADINLKDWKDSLGNEDRAAKDAAIAKATAAAQIESSAAVAKVVRDDWAKTSDEINRSLTDALLRGFESGKDFAKNLRDTIKNMFSTLVLRPVISAVMTPVSGAVNGVVQGGTGGSGSNLLGTASNLSSAYSFASGGFGAGLASSLGGMASAAGSLFGSSALSAFGAGMKGATLAPGLMGPTTVGATGAMGAGASAGSFLASIPGWGWALAGIGALFGGDIINGLFGRKLKDSGIEGDFGGASGFEGRQFEYYKGGLFRSDKTKYKDLDEEIRAALADPFNAMRSGAKEMAGVLGLGTQAIDGFTAHVKVSLKGLSAEEADKRLKEEFDKVAESLASTTLGTQDYTRAGETALQTLTRLSGSLTGVNQVFENLGATLYASSLAGADMASQLVDLFGGMDGLSQTAGSYMQNYYSADEQRAAVQRQLQKAFDGLELKLPDINASDARAQFRALAEAQDLTTESGRKTYAALLGLSGAFASITQSAEDAAAAAKQLAEAQARSVSDLLKRAIDRDRDALQYQASGMRDVVSALSASVSMLKSNARELYGQVDGTAQMLAAQGMVYIEQALGGVRAGASITDYAGLTDAIGAARGGINTGAYASQFERERDALILAGQLSELGELGDLQLSIEERQLKALTAQIDALDALGQRADDLINGTTALTGTVQDYFDKLLALLAPEEKDETTAKPGGNFAIGGSATGGGGSDSGTPYDKDAAVRYTVGAQLKYGADKGLSHEDPAVLKAINAAVYGTGITQADIAKAYGVPEDDIERLFAGVGLPKFDVGTNLVPRTGLAVVHEGEAIIPKAFNPWAGGQSAGGGNAEMIAELRALREEVAQLRAVSQATASSTAQMADQLDQVTEGGNAMRTEAIV